MDKIQMNLIDRHGIYEVYKQVGGKYDGREYIIYITSYGTDPFKYIAYSFEPFAYHPAETEQEARTQILEYLSRKKDDDTFQVMQELFLEYAEKENVKLPLTSPDIHKWLDEPDIGRDK